MKELILALFDAITEQNKIILSFCGGVEATKNFLDIAAYERMKIEYADKEDTNDWK